MTTRNIPIVRGDVRTIKITLTNATTGLPINIEDWPVTFSLTGQDGSIALQLALTEDPEASLGIARATITPEKSALLVAGMVYVGQVIYDSPDGPITVPIAACPVQHPARALV